MSRDVELMEYADGELPLDDALQPADAQAKLAAIRELGELVRGRLELAADEVPDARFDALWRNIDSAAKPSKPRFFDRYRSHILVGAVSAGAVGALALFLRPPRDEIRAAARSPMDVQRVNHGTAEIRDLETPGGVGTVFSLHDEDGSTTVIWVTPEDTVEGI